MEISEKIVHELIKMSFKGAVRCNLNLSECQKQYMCNNIDEAAKYADFCYDMIRETGKPGMYRNR